MTIPLGSRVRWADKYQKNAPIMGTVTGHPMARMVEVDGKGAISEGLLEVVEVGEMASIDLPEVYVALDAARIELSAAIAERDALQVLVVQQCEALAAADTGPQAKIEELREWVENVQDHLEGVLLAIYGERRPAKPIEPRELREMVDFVFEGVQ